MANEIVETKAIEQVSDSLYKGFNPRRLREYRQFYLVYPLLGIEVGNYIKKTISIMLILMLLQFGGCRPPNYKALKIKKMEFGG